MRRQWLRIDFYRELYNGSTRTYPPNGFEHFFTVIMGIKRPESFFIFKNLEESTFIPSNVNIYPKSWATVTSSFEDWPEGQNLVNLG